MFLFDLVKCSEDIAGVRSRNAKAQHIAELLRRCGDRAELSIAVSYLIGKLPQGRIGLGPSTIREARPTTSASEPSLVLPYVDNVFTTIATIKGPGSTGERIRLLQSMLEQSTEAEQRFLTLLVYGELQQGAMDGVMIDAVARASSVKVANLRRAVMSTGDLARVAVAALMDPDQLSRITVELFRPVQPMLAQPASDAAEPFSKDRAFAAELKLDGARIQVHKLDDTVRVFSRNLREVTHAVPEVVELVRAYPATSLVLDGEVLAVSQNGRPLPFQTTMRRFGRKLDVQRMRQDIPLTPFFFDILFCDGEPTIDLPLSRRSMMLGQHSGSAAVLQRPVQDAESALRFLQDAVSAGHEGIMIKALDSNYEAGARGADWFKIKPTHMLDLVVLAADWGHGRRTGWLSNLHLGAKDTASGGFVMLGKTFKGMTDLMLQWQTERLLSLEIGRDTHTVHVKPELVVEVAFNEVQTSPRYPAGLALRFARVKRYRDDKDATHVDTIDTVRSIHRQGVHDA